SHAAQRGRPLEPEAEADIELLRHAERLLASAIGTASSRLVLSLLLKKRSVSTTDALKLLDDANAAMQYNREVLQTALEHAQEGVSVFDRDGKLMVWNRPFAEVLDLPPETLHIGASFESVLRGLARRGDLVLFADFTYSASSREGLVPLAGPASGEVTIRSLTLAAGQRFDVGGG
ncbi:MAG: PAS-domain containing protein, partial [Bryobacteraceae bacterium]